MHKHHFFILVLVAIVAFLAAWFVWGGGVSAPTVSEPTPRLDFTATGTLVHNNPGLNANAWFLIYEKPGTGGLLTRLNFIDTSRCTPLGKRAVTCAPETLTDGMRVTVQGTEMADMVRVASLIVIKEE